MPMPRLILAVPVLFALAACNQQQSTQETAAKTGEVSLTNASPAEVAKQAQAAGGAHFTPGEWETAVDVTEVDLPGVPAEMREQMKKTLMSATKVVKSCMTPEQAAKPQAGMLSGKNDGRCTYKNFTMAGGRIDAVMVCAGAQGAEMTQTIAGTYTDTSFALTSSMDATGGPGGGMKMKARTNGRRIGECKS
jgi:hypothetical protein